MEQTGSDVSKSRGLKIKAKREPVFKSVSTHFQAWIPVTFTTANWLTQQTVRVEVNEDGKFLAKESTSYQCIIRHTIDTQDAI